MECFEVGSFWGMGRFVAETFWGWAFLEVGPYVVGCFVFGTFLGWEVFVLGRFVGASIVL